MPAHHSPPLPARGARPITFDDVMHGEVLHGAPHSDVERGDDALTLPEPWSAPARPPVPLVASLVPLIGALVLWAVTGSPMMLWFALLGPLIAVASQVDAARGARRGKRRAESDARAKRTEVERTIERRHSLERERRWAQHPDVATISMDDAVIWRAAPHRGDVFVIGSGVGTSEVRTYGGASDEDSVRIRTLATMLPGAPITAPLQESVVVVGSDSLTEAVLRAWVLQVCAILPPDALRVVADSTGAHAWAAHLPHCNPRFNGAQTLALVEPGCVVPEADIVFARSRPGEPVPPRCATVVTVAGLESAWVDRAGRRTPVRVEAVSREQADAVASVLAQRADRTWGGGDETSVPVMLSDLHGSVPPGPSGALTAVLGRGDEGVTVIDLVGDGPHAVVAGVTGSGKSELLITWVLSLSAMYSTSEVNFLLADFKGGTAFDSLVDVPHVTGVITDLDGAGARRAIESLRAEVRWREGMIASSGARDISDPRVVLPRLIVVVDEFAALMGEHPELHAVFTDVAARGRALGIHLVLGTQRITGVVRDSLLANCPLRISLRVTDSADSRALLGVEDAALLPGGSAGRGQALVRRAADVRCHRTRVALSQRRDVDAVRASGGTAPKRPWLPELPRTLSLTELHSRFPGQSGILLGLADEPARQHQGPVSIDIEARGILFLGGAGSGKSSALGTVEAQAPADVVRVPASPEDAWDVLTGLVERPPRPSTVVVIDDLDALPARFGPEYGPAVVEVLEDVLRSAGTRQHLIVAGARRVTGAIARVADLFPHRVVLPLASRGEHIAAGADAEHYSPDAPPGRAIHRGVLVQLAQSPSAPSAESAVPRGAAPWMPIGDLAGFIARRSPAARGAIAEWQRNGIVVRSVDEYAQRPEVEDGRCIVAGEPDEWQRHWRLLTQLRGEHELVIDASCASEFRLLSGQRGLPPFIEAGRGRAWLLHAGAEAERIVLPGV